jgi:hypothetical protein
VPHAILRQAAPADKETVDALDPLANHPLSMPDAPVMLALLDRLAARGRQAITLHAKSGS